MTDLLSISSKHTEYLSNLGRCGDHGAEAPVSCEGGGEHQGVRGAGGARQDGQDPGATGASVTRALCEHYVPVKSQTCQRCFTIQYAVPIEGAAGIFTLL